jgi:hypothetical protein
VFDSGARLETVLVGTSASGRYLNASGQPCGSFEVPDPTMGPAILTNDGERFTLHADGTVGCPNGHVVQLADIQADAIAECTGAHADACDLSDLRNRETE